MPYGYYQLVRFISFTAFGYLAYNEYKNSKKLQWIIYFILAILFQPFFKVALGRDLWNILDVVVGLGLLISIFTKNRQTKEYEN
jgi:hypothetical protein